MKTLRTLFITAVMIMVTLTAFSQPSNLTIRLSNYKTFKLIFDNTVYTRSTSYFVPNIRHGYHNIAVYEIKGRHRNGHGNGNFEQMVFSGRIFIEGNRTIEAVVDKHSGYRVIRETPIARPATNHYGHNSHPGQGNYGVNSHGTGEYYGNNHHGGNGSGYSGYCMNEEQFRMLLRTMDEKSFNSSKIEIAKTALIHNRVNSRQVLEIAKRLPFESSRLEIAKYAYSRTVDPENYYIVNGAFSFSSSSEELGRFIRSGRY